MAKVVVRKGYRCLPGKRRELLAALQRMDALAAEAGWPRGRYLLVETRAPGEPDLEVEFTFESYAEMEQLERRLREHRGRSSRDQGGAGTAAAAGQEFLIESSATRFLLLLDDGAAAAGTGSPARRTVQPRPPQPRPQVQSAPPPEPPPHLPAAQGIEEPPPPEPEPEPEPEPPALTPAQLQARQLAQARAALAQAERAVNLPPERRADQRRPA